MAKLCVIPARGGSKRIPKKNIRDFLGKPIIAYSISAALESSIFDEVMVSTDDEEIADIAREYGAKTPFFRSQINSSDHASTYDVLEEVLNKYSEQGKHFQVVCCLYPCAPLITSDKLKESLVKLSTAHDAVIPIVRFSFPIQRAFRTDGESLEYIQPEFEKTRSQDLESSYHDAGQFYFSNTDALFKQRTLVPKKATFIELDEMEVQDIDNETDWNLAELKYQLRKNEIS